MDSLAKEVLEVTNESSSEPNHININDNNDNYLSNNTHGYHLGSDGNSIIDENVSNLKILHPFRVIICELVSVINFGTDF